MINTPNPVEDAPGESDLLWKAVEPGVVAVMLSAVALAGGVGLELIRLAERLHIKRCPLDTFVVGGTKFTIIVIPILMTLVTMSACLILFIVSQIPGASEYYDRSARSRSATSYRNTQKFCAIFSIASLLWTLPLGGVLFLNQFCLTPNAILNQAAPWSGLKAFPWTRVKTVTTTCRPYQRDNTWFGDYELTLDNGRDITLSSQTTVGLWEPAYPLIARALHGHSFTFDRSRAETECPLRMFTQRP